MKKIQLMKKRRLNNKDCPGSLFMNVWTMVASPPPVTSTMSAGIISPAKENRSATTFARTTSLDRSANRGDIMKLIDRTLNRIQ